MRQYLLGFVLVVIFVFSCETYAACGPEPDITDYTSLQKWKQWCIDCGGTYSGDTLESITNGGGCKINSQNSSPSSTKQPTHTEFQQMVEQLQHNPTDNALREKVIKAAQELKPALAIPEEARKYIVRANAAMKEANTSDDYAHAAQLYQEALKIAPWYGDAYYNLATAQDKTQDYAGEMASLKFYLLTNPADTEARQVQDKIYVLEEKANKQAAINELKKAVERARYKVKMCYTGFIDENGNIYKKGRDIPMNTSYEYIGCNLDEANGSNWGNRIDVFAEFIFSDDQMVQIKSDFYGILLIGSYDEKSDHHIKWICPKTKQSAYIRNNNLYNGKGIIYSCETTDPTVNPSTRYIYFWLERQ